MVYCNCMIHCFIQNNWKKERCQIKIKLKNYARANKGCAQNKLISNLGSLSYYVNHTFPICIARHMTISTTVSPMH